MQIGDINDSYIGKNVFIRGWVYRHRTSKNITFVVLRDSSGIIQVTFKHDNPFFKHAENLSIESSVEIEGIVKKDERAPTGYEVEGKTLKVVHRADVFPITKDKSIEFLLDKRHLWLRSREQNVIMKIKDAVIMVAHEWFHENGFYFVTPPIITKNACEGGSTLFEMKYFEDIAYLSQSAQLYLEAIMFNLEKVYSLTPSFRAEKSRTTRHLAEFWHLEGEEAWVDNEGNMKIQEELVKHICHKVAELRPNELKLLGRDPEDLLRIKTPFPRIEHKKAVKMLLDMGLTPDPSGDFGAKEERALTENSKQPLFVVNFPKEAKAFYMKENPNDPKTYLCADLLAPEGFGEIIGGSERETDFDKLVERLKKEGANIKDYEWYLELRRYGSVPHSGFGLGIERVVKWICKSEHIREAQPFPRTLTRCQP